MTDARPVRVAYCLDSFAVGGTELNALRTAESLDRSRVELSVYYLHERGPLRSRYESLGVAMTHLPIANLYSPRTQAQGLRLGRALRAGDVDVLHSHDLYCNIFAVPWARLLSSTSVIASRRWGRTASRPALAFANRLANRLAHRVVANSGAVARILAQEEGVPQAKIVEIPNFLDDAAFAEPDGAETRALRRAWGVPEGAFAIGIVARLSPVKNHAMLFEALAMLDGRFHVVCVGDGPCRADLEAQAGRLGIAGRVHLVGEDPAAARLHRHFDASVLCSLSEGFPNALIEAMAARRPVVATPVGGVVDALAPDVSGLVVPVGDAEGLARALRTLAEDPGLCRRLGEAARETARAKYQRAEILGRLTDLYETLARRRSSCPEGHSHA